MSSEPNSTTPSLLKYLTPDNDNNSSFDTLEREPIRNFDIELAKLTYHKNSKKRDRILHLAIRINDNIDSLKADLKDNQFYFKIQSQFDIVLNKIIARTQVLIGTGNTWNFTFENFKVEDYAQHIEAELIKLPLTHF